MRAGNSSSTHCSSGCQSAWWSQLLQDPAEARGVFVADEILARGRVGRVVPDSAWTDRAAATCRRLREAMLAVTDGAEVMNALSCHFGYDGYETAGGPPKVDAVVHFAAVPRILLTPDNHTFETNVMSTYNVIEAAMKLGTAIYEKEQAAAASPASDAGAEGDSKADADVVDAEFSEVEDERK